MGEKEGEGEAGGRGKTEEEENGLLYVPHYIFLTSPPTLVPTYTSKEERDKKGNEDESSSKGFYWPQYSRGCTCLGKVSFVPPAC